MDLMITINNFRYLYKYFETLVYKLLFIFHIYIKLLNVFFSYKSTG